jgi:23S rRNA pseudouridine1911/1915/1917 synthase
MMKQEQTVYTKKVPKILYEDTHLLVLSKPSGLLSQGNDHNEWNLVDWARSYLKRNYVGLIHRLDRETSGIILIAKRSKAANRISEQLVLGHLKRQYQGWVIGKMNQPHFWTHQILKQKNFSKIITPSDPHLKTSQKDSLDNSKEASLEAFPLKHIKFQNHILTLVSFILHTGRNHQIRVQASYENFPLLGDSRYGKGLPFPRLALHSYQVEFSHPMSLEKLVFIDPLPDVLVLKNS